MATSSSSKPVTEVLATPGRGSDRPREIRYTDTKIIGNGSFGVVYQAVMVGENGGNDVIAIKKVNFELTESKATTKVVRFYKTNDSKIANCQ